MKSNLEKLQESGPHVTSQEAYAIALLADAVEKVGVKMASSVDGLAESINQSLGRSDTAATNPLAKIARAFTMGSLGQSVFKYAGNKIGESIEIGLMKIGRILETGMEEFLHNETPEYDEEDPT